MLTMLVLDAPAGFGGPGRVRASVHGCPAALPSAVQLRGSGLPGSALLGADRTATGGALPVGVAVRGTEPTVAVQPVAIQPVAIQPVAVQPFATTHPYSTLGNHPPGRPQS